MTQEEFKIPLCNLCGGNLLLKQSRGGMWGIRVGMQGIRVGMQGIRVGMRGIRVILCENLHVYCFG